MSPIPETDPNRLSLLVRYSGDISTKATQTKLRFNRRLAHNLADALRANDIRYRIRRSWDRFYIEVDQPTAVDVLPRVFGVQSLSLAHQRPFETLDDVVREGESLFREAVTGKRFAVRTRRAGNVRGLPFQSMDVDRALGTALLPQASRVDLTTPEITVHVELKAGQVWFFEEKLAGPGGLPVGTGGKALALVSGGFDSAVAAWYLLKRGVALHYLFFNLGGEAHREDVLRVTKVLADHWSYGTTPHLTEVDFQEVSRMIQGVVEPRYWQIVLKRIMLRAAEHVLRYSKAVALVTGDAVAQVSSQTLQNLAVISRATTAPILRPLIGFNKEEIIAQARHIGTYELSAGVEEYCAIVPRNPATNATLPVIEAEEAKLDHDRLVQIFDERTKTDLRTLELTGLGRADLEVTGIPDGATVIDLRSRTAYDAWHAPGALHLDFLQALNAYRAFEKGPVYALYCEVGLKSAHLAELMEAAGIRAVHVHKGVRTLLRNSAEAEAILDLQP